MEQNKIKNISKKITCIIIILMLCNFIIPNFLTQKTALATDTSKFFDKSITFSSEYISGNGDIMPHGIITPSTASSSNAIPLIVWLHGDGEFGGGKSTCMGDNNSNLFPRALMDSSLEKFNAYVLLPHATGDWKTTDSNGLPTWYSSEARKNVSTLIENFVKEKGNVDINNIIIAGHSRGGMGAQYMAANMDKMSYKFSKLAVLSGFNTGINFDNIKIPTRGYVGTEEQDSAYSFMTDTFGSHFENIKVTASHAAVPRIVYNIDKNNNGKGNGRSDLIEWMFGNVNSNFSGFFDPNITFTNPSDSYYEGEGAIMPYSLYKPSTVKTGEKIPMIVYLHGVGGKGASKSDFLTGGIHSVISNWSKEGKGFKAYILCPHMTGDWIPDAHTWKNPQAKAQIVALLDKVIQKYNVDTNNIIISGHSLGGQGALYMAHQLPNYFSKAVVFSGYSPSIDEDEIKIPTIGFVGTEDAGEAPGSINYMINDFEPVFGTQNMVTLKTAHGSVPSVAFKRDVNNNGRSDVVEWMFGYIKDIKTGTLTGGGIGSSVGTDGEIYIQRVEVTGDEGDLFNDMAQMFCFIPDMVIDFLQKMFVNSNSIDVGDGTWSIRYSPGTIFAGKIPAFDINFIEPNPNSNIDYTYEKFIEEEANKTTISEEKYNELMENVKKHEGYQTKTYTKSTSSGRGGSTTTTTAIYYENKEEGVLYLELFKYTVGGSTTVNKSYWHEIHKYNLEDIGATDYGTFVDERVNKTTITEEEYNELMKSAKSHEEHQAKKYIKSTSSGRGGSATTTTAIYYENKEEGVLYLEIFKYTVGGSTTVSKSYWHEIHNYYIHDIGIKGDKTYTSTASILQPIVATWYNALRRIALVGLLSVLVYIGIRIVLTSTSAKDKAKYKNMLKDWLVALCLLFTLHYIMSITITIVEEINEIFASSVVGTDGEDVLMTTVRNSIASAGKWKEVVAQVIIYFVLGVYTIIFTIQYVRRTIYLAFLTMIAPLITLTYPLDKIKDSKSQAFDMWIKDYVFFTLLQVAHLLLYYILVGSSIQLTNSDNWLFAIVAIGFLAPAEKIIKKMFGFEKSNSMGALAAGASGALVMNAINKIKGMGGKTGKAGASGSSEGAGEGSSNKIRTATGDPLSSLRARIQGTGGEGVTASITTASTGTNTTGGSTTQSANSGASGQSGKPSRSLSGGAGSIFKKYTGPSVKKILGTTSDLFLGGTGALVGLAAGVAQGDVGAAFTGALAGAAAGKGLRQGVTNKAVSMGNSIKNFGHEFMDTAREGAYGAEYADMIKFKRSSDYQELKKNHKDSLTDENLQTMLSAGITEKDAMGKILQNGSDNIEDAIGYYTLAKECPDSIYYDRKILAQFIEDKLTEDGQSISSAEVERIVDNMKKYR